MSNERSGTIALLVAIARQAERDGHGSAYDMLTDAAIDTACRNRIEKFTDRAAVQAEELALLADVLAGNPEASL